jgi:predicted O-methyltransferase YrrM
MIYQNYSDVVTDDLAKGAILNPEFPGFLEDYLVLHCLIRKYKPKTFLEIGTKVGTGTNVICNAGEPWGMKVFSLDLPQEWGNRSNQYAGAKLIGSVCKRKFTQLWNDSMEFDYEGGYEGIFIDGEHDYHHPFHESVESMKAGIGLIIYHDADITEVGNAIENVYKHNTEYTLYRVENTRMAYAIKK